MAKAPHLGRAKTRLRGFLTDHETETLAGAFFADTLRCAQTTGVQIIIAFTPTGGSRELKTIASNPDTFIWTEQINGNLGERMASAAEFARAQGFWPIVFLGADSPNLPPETVRSALDLLECGPADIVLGPCLDGGYYLIGLRRFDCALFDNVPWSTADVFDQTYSNAEKLEYEIEVLEPWYDVDEVGDLRRLIMDVRAAPATAPATRHWLEQHGDLTFSEAGDTCVRESEG